jgi:adenosylhomocysteine nucleosidase
MSRVAIVAALEREVRPLIKPWRVTERQHSGRSFRFFETEDVVLVGGGIGAEAARRAAEAAIVLYQPEIVYSAGYAGALDPAICIGQIIRPARVIDVGDGSSVSIAGGEGVLVTAGSVAGPAQKDKLRESFRAKAVDMEAAAVARAAEARGIEFAAIKAISDEFGFEFPAVDRFVDSEGCFQEKRFALFVAVRPWLWLRVIELARNSRRASRALCEELQKLVGNAVSSAAAAPQQSRTQAR